jgi:hypothetical protein
MAEAMVLSESETLELLAFLVTAARTQIDEPAEYAPLRLLTAASRLADLVGDRVSPATRALLAGPLRDAVGGAVGALEPDAYTRQLDELCAAVAAHLVSHFGLDRGRP